MALTKIERRARIRKRIRKQISGTAERPRMSLFRSNKQIYVQFVDDINGVTLASASSLDKEIIEECKGKSGIEVSKIVGALAAKKALEKGVETVVFDRGGYLFHGRIKSVADAARQGGLKF